MIIVKNKTGINYITGILILSVICIFFQCSRKNFTEKEPNNDIYNANSIDVNSVIEGFLDTPSDRDIYQLTITSPAVLDIELSPVKGINHAFKVWQGDGQKIIKYVDDGRKSSPERMCNLFVDTGIYYLAVLHGERDNPGANKDDSYKLRISARDWASEEIESNDSIETANLIEIGREITGYYSPASNRLNRAADSTFKEEDWFYFQVELQYDRPILLDISLSGVVDVNSAIFLYNSMQELIASSDLNGPGEGESLKDIGITHSGSYFIRLNSDFGSSNEFPYRLLVTTREFDNLSEIEPNNTFAKANILSEKSLTARLYPADDIDFYYYENGSNEGEMNAPLMYKIEAVPDTDLDIILKVFDKNENKLFEIDNNKNGGIEVMPNALISGNFYIGVSSKQRHDSQDYKLSVISSQYAAGYEREPNDSRDKASVIMNDRAIGFISRKADIDYYYLAYNKRLKRKFTIQGIKDSELKVSVTDPLGYIIKTETVSGNETKTFSEMIDNKCYIIVEAISENYSEPYKIEIGD